MSTHYFPNQKKDNYLRGGTSQSLEMKQKTKLITRVDDFSNLILRVKSHRFFEYFPSS